MRVSPTLLIVMLIWGPQLGSAQEKTVVPSVFLAPNSPVVDARPAVTVMDVVTAPVAFSRLADELFRRLQPIQQRLQNDQRMRSAGGVLGLGIVAFGALRGQNSLTLAGTQALRFGFDKQLTDIRHRSGFALEPSIGHRAIAITVSRTFD